MISHGITASCRFGVANQTDVYLIGPDGGLNISSAVGGGPWSDLFGPQPGALFQPGAAVAASPQYGLAQTDVFAVGTNGQLYVMWADGDDSWNNPYPIGPTGVFPPGAAVAASAQYGVPDTTVVFAVGNAGQLTVTWVGKDGVWKGPATIGATGVFPPGAAVAASAQYGVPDQTDVFAVGNAGQLTVTWVGKDGVWKGPATIGATGVFPPGAAVAASAQYGVPDQTDVFAVGNAGQLTVTWVGKDGQWKGPATIGATGVFPPGAAVAASPQYGVPDTTDVFAVGNAGQLTVTWVGKDGQWKGPATIGATGVFPPGAAVAASPQYGVPDTTDVFAVNNNSEPTVTWVGPDGQWKGPANLVPDPQITLPIIEDPRLTVTGTHFTPSGEVWLKYWVTGNNGPTPATQNGLITVHADRYGRIGTKFQDPLGHSTTLDVNATDVATGRIATGKATDQHPLDPG